MTARSRPAPIATLESQRTRQHDRLALASIGMLLTVGVGVVTLGPSSLVAEARSVLMGAVVALLGQWLIHTVPGTGYRIGPPDDSAATGADRR